MATNSAANKVRAEGEAWRIWDHYGFSHPSGLPLVELAASRNLKIRTGGLPGARARLVRVGDSGIIRLRDEDIYTGAARFAISHEMGHWALHKESQGFVCDAQDLRDYRKSPQEAEANIFAAELLMPKQFVAPLLRRKGVSMHAAQAMAEEFNVSLTSASIRMMNLSRDTCGLVFSKNRQVQWWVSSTDAFGIWLGSKQPLSIDSAAYHLGDADRGSFDVEEDVPFAAWFPNSPRSGDPATSEQSCYLRAAGGVLTLLAIDAE